MKTINSVVRLSIRATAVAMMLSTVQARADVAYSSFDTPADFSFAGDVGQSTISGGKLVVIDDSGSKKAAAWLNTPQHLAGGFDATFSFDLTTTGTFGDGFAFVMHNDVRGVTAVGGLGGSKGYGTRFVNDIQTDTGIRSSFAVDFNTYQSERLSLHSNGLGENNSGGGTAIGPTVTLNPGDLTGGTRYARVHYLPGYMKVWVDDTGDFTGPAIISQAVNLGYISSADNGSISSSNAGSILDGSGDALVGFTAGTGAARQRNQLNSFTLAQAGPVNNFAISSFDSSSVEQIQTNVHARIENDRLIVNDENGGRRGSAFYRQRVRLEDGFRTQFDFQINNTSGDPADGFAFVLHNDPNGVFAIGSSGGGLGYGDNLSGTGSPHVDDAISQGVAVEFDTYSDTGISVHSSGLDPLSVDESTSIGGNASLPFNITDGAIYRAVIEYDPALEELSISIVDTADAGRLFERTISINLNDIGGANVLDSDGAAWLGFTGATGGLTESHEILNWQVQGIPEPASLTLIAIMGCLPVRRRG